MSAVDVVVMSEADARRITERIRYTAMSVRDGVDKLQRLVAEAQEGQAHVALGYASWTAYLAEVMGEEPLRLARDDRREVVQWLSGEGMSVRAISAVTGAPKSTVSDDLSGVRFRTPEAGDGVIHADRQVFNSEQVPASPESEPVGVPDGAPEISVDESTGEVIEDAEVVEDDTPLPKPVTGLDGKTYKRPEPKPERRRSIVDDAYSANTNLWKVIETIRTISNDDRFTRNKADILAALQPSADLAIEILTDLFNITLKEN